MAHFFKGTKINFYEQTNEKLILLQSDKKYPLSKFYSNEGSVKAIINCSYFTNDYVLGRNQGDLKNDTHDQSGFIDLVFFEDGSYQIGNFRSWEYQTGVKCGFSVASILIKDGKDYEEVSIAIESGKKLVNRNPQSAIAVLDTGKVVFIQSDGRNILTQGLTGHELREWTREQFPNVQLLCQLDGGGSSELIIDGKIQGQPSDGHERSMFNGLALIEVPQKVDEVDMSKVMFPCAEGWDSQGFHSGHKAIDVGWLKSQSSDGKTPILACQDGIVEYADFYEETVSGKRVKPIVCIIRHETKNNTWYSAYWHLSSTPKNKGDLVKMGDEIGTKGNTGFSGGTHLHFVLMKCPKGASMPSSYEFDKYAVNPIDYIEVYDNQVFESHGNYDLKRHAENKADLEALKVELDKYKQKCETLEIDYLKLETEHSKAQETINQIKKILGV